MDNTPENIPAENKKKKTPPGKKILKKFLRLIKWTAVVIAVLLILLMLFRDPILKSCITRFGSIMTGTNISVDELETSLSGQIKITNLTISNPNGFKEKHLLKISSFYADADMLSLLTDEITLEDLDINELHLVGEFSSGGDSNIGKLISKPGRKSPTEETPQVSKNKPSRKFFIRKFAIRNSSIKICDPQSRCSVVFDLLAGSTTEGFIELNGLTITAPVDFKEKNIAELEKFHCTFDADSIFSDRVVIKSLGAENFKANCEFKNDGSFAPLSAINIIPESDDDSVLIPVVIIENTFVRNSSLKVIDRRTGCVFDLPLEAKYARQVYDSTEPVIETMRNGISYLADMLDDFSNAEDMLKNTVQKGKNFFQDSGEKIIDIFRFNRK